MKNTSISKEYFIHSIDGRSYFNNSKLRAGLVMAGLLDLFQAEVIEFNKKKIEVCKALPTSMDYLSLIYDYVAEKPRKMEKVISTFCMSLTDKKIKELINNVGTLLVESDKGEEGQKGVFKKTVYVPDQEYKKVLIDELRNNMLSGGTIHEKDIALVSLLDAVGLLKNIFDKSEIKDLEKKIKEVKVNPDNKSIKKMVTYTEQIAAAWAVCAVSTTVLTN